MTALPATTDWTGGAITEGGFKTAQGNLHDYLAGLLGTDGTQATALSTIGSLLAGTVTKTSSYTVVAGDVGKLIDCTTGTWSLILTAAATLGTGFVFGVKNSGAGVITIDPNGSELVDGVATIALNAGESCLLSCNGTAWISVAKIIPAAVIATAGEVTTGTDNTKMVTPLAAQGLLVAAAGTIPAAQSGNVNGTATTMTKLVEFYVPRTGTITTTMYIKATSSNPTITGRIYKNGSPVGTTRTTTLNTYQAFSENIAVTKGDLIQLYGMTSNVVYSYDEYLKLFEAFPPDYFQTV